MGDRRNSFSSNLGGGDGNGATINVSLRFRPIDDKNERFKFEEMYSANEHSHGTLHMRHPLGIRDEKQYQFNNVFPPTASQEELFKTVALPLVDRTLSGYNSCCFAYGQTGAGKTYTIVGEGNHEKRGFLPRVVENIFEKLQSRSKVREIGMTIQFVEVYLDKVRDLGLPFVHQREYKRIQETATTNKSVPSSTQLAQYAPGKAKDILKDQNLEIHETKGGRVYVKGASVIPVSTRQEVLDIINLGVQTRATFETALNATSSRSHTIFTISIVQKKRTSNAGIPTSGEDALTGSLTLVDLAGSERVSKSGSENLRFSEAVVINKSLTALGKVILALSKDRTDREKAAGANREAPVDAHIPFRDSKLTRLLQNSLDASTATALIACVNPAVSNFDETACTLQFAERCAGVSIDPQVNLVRGVGHNGVKVNGADDLVRMRQQIASISERLNANKNAALTHVKALQEMGVEVDGQLWDLASTCASYAPSKSKGVKKLADGSTVPDDHEDEGEDEGTYDGRPGSSEGPFYRPSGGSDAPNSDVDGDDGSDGPARGGGRIGAGEGVRVTAFDPSSTAHEEDFLRNANQVDETASSQAASHNASLGGVGDQTLGSAYFSSNPNRLNTLMRKLTRDEGLGLIRGVLKNFYRDALAKDTERCTRARRRVLELAEFTEKTALASEERLLETQRRTLTDKGKAQAKQGELDELLWDAKEAKEEALKSNKEEIEGILKAGHLPLASKTTPLNPTSPDYHPLRDATLSAGLLEALMEEREEMCEAVRQRCMQVEEEFKREADSQAIAALQALQEEAEKLGEKQRITLVRKAQAIARFIKETRAYVKPRNALVSLLQEDLLDWLTYVSDLQRLIHRCQNGDFPIAFKAGRRSVVIPDAAKPSLKLRNLGANDQNGPARNREVRALEAINEEQNKIRQAISGLGVRPALAESDLYIDAESALPSEDLESNDLRTLRGMLDREFMQLNKGYSAAVPANVPAGHHQGSGAAPFNGSAKGELQMLATGSQLVNNRPPALREEYIGQSVMGVSAAEREHFDVTRGDSEILDSNYPSMIEPHSTEDVVNSLPKVKLARSNQSGAVEPDSSLEATSALRHIGSKLRLEVTQGVQQHGLPLPDASNANSKAQSLNASLTGEGLRDALTIDQQASQVLARTKGQLTTATPARASTGGNPAAIELTEVLERHQKTPAAPLMAEQQLQHGLTKPDLNGSGRASLASTGVPQLDDTFRLRDGDGGLNETFNSLSPTFTLPPKKRTHGSSNDSEADANPLPGLVADRVVVPSGATARMIVPAARSLPGDNQALLTSLDPKNAALRLALTGDLVERLLQTQAASEVPAVVDALVKHAGEVHKVSTIQAIQNGQMPSTAAGHAPGDFSEGDVLRATKALVNDASLPHVQQMVLAARQMIIDLQSGSQLPPRAEGSPIAHAASSHLHQSSTSSAAVQLLHASMRRGSAGTQPGQSLGASSLHPAPPTAQVSTLNNFAATGRSIGSNGNTDSDHWLLQQVESQAMAEHLQALQAECEALREDMSMLRGETTAVDEYKRSLEKQLLGSLQTQARTRLNTVAVASAPGGNNNLSFTSPNARSQLSGSLNRSPSGLRSTPSTPKLPSINNQSELGATSPSMGASISKSGKMSSLWARK